jgi:hypothetical protein
MRSDWPCGTNGWSDVQQINSYFIFDVFEVDADVFGGSDNDISSSNSV